MPRYGPFSGLTIARRLEVEELGRLVEEYDILFEKCMTRPMINEEHKRLNELFETLSHIEMTYWEDVPDHVLPRLQHETDTDFPMILHILGMLPIEDN